MSALTGFKYVRSRTHDRRRDTARFYTKPSTPGYTGGGYELWRSVEERPHTPSTRGKEDCYVAHHRLLAVVACYDLDTPIEDVLADLDGKDVHHESGVGWDNRPDNLTVIDHGRHSEITQAQVRAWAADAKADAADDPEPTADGTCPSCGDEMDVAATSEGFDGPRCLACAKRECDGHAIEV